MHILLDSLARLMAPLLPFTAEEIWEHMPDSGDKAPSVHLVALPEANSKWKNEDLVQKWGKILERTGRSHQGAGRSPGRKTDWSPA